MVPGRLALQETTPSFPYQLRAEQKLWMIESVAWFSPHVPIKLGRRFATRPYDLFYDPGTGLAFKSTANIFRVGDQCFLPAVLQKPDDGLDLRSHGSFGKMYAF